jgi:hypothetical protein
MGSDSTALVRGDRRAGITQPHTPVIGNRNQNEWIDPAIQGLGIGTETTMNAATPILVEKDTITIGAMLKHPAEALANKQGLLSDLVRPILGLNPLAFVVADVNRIVLTAQTAAVTVPILNHR